MPVGKKTIENVLRILQVLKMSTWISVTHLPNETQFLTNEGAEIYRPVTENQVVKMSTSFFVSSQGLLKIRCRHLALDFTCNGISGSKWPTEKAGRAVHSGQLARSKSAEGAALCPSDMMLCVISYWVLSGAKRRQIQQLRCCAFPAKLLKRRNVYLKLTRHNGRAGTHGTYNPKHNDRSFNLANSEHIDPERAKGNIYRDCFHGFRSALAPPDPDDLAATFSDVERQFYESRYTAFVESQNERNAKIRHTERNRSIPDLLSSRKTCPEETIYQLGTLDELTLKVNDMETLIDEVSAAAYDKAVEVVTDVVRIETRKEDMRMIEDTKKWVLSPERKAPKATREYAAHRLDTVLDKFLKTMQTTAARLQEKLLRPEVRQKGKEQVKEKARDSVLQLLNRLQAEQTQRKPGEQHTAEKSETRGDVY